MRCSIEKGGEPERLALSAGVHAASLQRKRNDPMVPGIRISETS